MLRTRICEECERAGQIPGQGVFGLKKFAMLWAPHVRRTRSGAEFSPYASITALCASSFDFAPLLATSLAAESDGDNATDHESDDDDDASEPDATDGTSPPPSLDPITDVDDYSPLHLPMPRSISPPRKRARTTPDDMQEGKKPQTGANRRRAAKRVRSVQQAGYEPRDATVCEFVRPAKPIPTSLKTEALPSAHGAYAAKVAKEPGGKKPRSLPELVAMGFRVVEWNGFDPQPLVDANGRIFAVLAGQPRAPEYAASVKRVYSLLCEQAALAAFPRAMCVHRRGLFAVINVGILYGKGQRVPSFLNNHNYTPIADTLLKDPDVGRLATFASASYQLWAPRLYDYYHDHQRRLHLHFPNLRRNFPKSVFSCAAFNFGPNAWTFRHRDVLNLPFGWGAVQAAGPFNPKKGGHPVLWDLMLVIEFPPGALILLPSATIKHSNVPVQPGDRRASFTQYTAGGIMRFVDNGFRTEKELAEEDPEEFVRMLELKKTRWEMGLALLSTVDELLDTPE